MIIQLQDLLSASAETFEFVTRCIEKDTCGTFLSLEICEPWSSSHPEYFW